ncbi:MAG: dipeptidase, partial [Planctomycetes bacterium]|nr:dipeptidase [Planctomycetota bacterium]
MSSLSRLPPWFLAGLLFPLAAVAQPTAEAPRTDRPVTTQPGPVIMSAEGWRIHRAGLLVDGHNDLPWQIRRLADSSFDKLDIAQPQEELQTDIPRLRRGGVGAQFWVVFAPPEAARSGTAAHIALEQFDLIHRMVKRYPDVFKLALTADDVVRIREEGKIAALIGVEGGHVIENSLETLARFYELGARYMGLTHSETIDWADSCSDEPRNSGLSPF